MARPPQDAIETFMSITGASEAVAVQKLEEHGGDLNEAVNAYFNDGDRANVQPPSIPTPHDDVMSIDERADIEFPQSINPLLSAVRSINPFSLLDPNFGRSVLDGGGGSGFSSHAPRVSHPREVREIPIDFKDDNSAPGFSGQRPTIEDVTGSVTAHGPEIRGTVVIDDDEDDLPHTSAHPGSGIIAIEDDMEDIPFLRHHGPSVTALVDETDYSNDIEEEMLQAALEASRQEAEGHSNKHFDAANNSSVPQFAGTSPSLDDIELERAVSLSLKTAEQERALREKGKEIGEGASNSSDMEVEEMERTTMANGRQEYATEKSGNTSQLIPEVKSSSYGEAEDVDEQPLVRRRSGHFGSGNLESGAMDNRTPAITQQHDVGSHIQHNGDNFPSDEWGGISNEEHDEAVMLEAAMFGGIPEGSDFHFAYPTGSDRSAAMYPRAPRPPSPTLTAQRLLREQQDGEYLAALQADREKELKARQEAELRRLEEAAAKEAAVEKQRHLEEEKRKRLLEEEEFERKLTAKKASLPQEPSLEDENAITLVVRMPDGSRHGRRFLKSDKLQSLFDFIDIGRVVKPGTYRLVRPYPRRAFTDGESELSLSELGLTSKQEALYMELI